MKNNRNNLDKALGQFIEAIRLFLVSELKREYGKSWELEYYNALSEKQKSDWDNQSKGGRETSSLIDFNNLSTFAIKEKKFFKSFSDAMQIIFLPNLMRLQMRGICLLIMTTGTMTLPRLLSCI